jgi:hypothetical protein
MPRLTPALAPSLALLLIGCAADPHGIPGAAPTVSRAETLAIADQYARLQWTPEARHVHHGPDADGIPVHTPDILLEKQGIPYGSWQAGKPQTGMPYQWGGFDTPSSYLASLQRGEYAGDVSTAWKRANGDAAVSRHACGIDCSGFVSRCWRLAKPVSTRDLPAICQPLSAWSDLKPGDILLNEQHVLMFSGWQFDGRSILAYEAGPRPAWRVAAHGMPVEFLRNQNYRPFRYRNIRD